MPYEVKVVGLPDHADRLKMAECQSYMANMYREGWRIASMAPWGTGYLYVWEREVKARTRNPTTKGSVKK